MFSRHNHLITTYWNHYEFNLGSHKAKPVRRLIRAAGAKLFFLPRYSPDLNPIEQVFAKLKTLLRKTDPRTIEATWRRIGDLLGRFTPQECANYDAQCRICFNLTGSRSSCRASGPGADADVADAAVLRVSADDNLR